MDLALNNLQRLICHKIQPTNQPTNKGCYAIKPRNQYRITFLSQKGQRGQMFKLSW